MNIITNFIICHDNKTFPYLQSLLNKGEIDFNLIVPKPASKYECIKEVLDGVTDKNDIWKDSIDSNWMDLYWGCCSNGMEANFYPGTKIITFETAWCAPTSISYKLFKDGYNFEHYYHGELFGDNLYQVSMDKILGADIELIEVDKDDSPSDRLKYLAMLTKNEHWFKPEVED